MNQPPVVSGRGSRYEVGLAHGEQARGLVHQTLAWSLEQLATGGVGPDEARSRAGSLIPYVEDAFPELLEECRGIADGAGLPLVDVVVINARYELLFLTGSSAPRPGVAGAECSLIGFTSDRTYSGHPMIGQNVDLGADARPLWIVLDVAPDDAPRVLTVTMAGMLAQEGLNSSGLALCGSMVRSSDWRTGLPTRKFLRRKVLEQPDVASAIDLIRRTKPRASSHNLMLADGTAVVDVETTAEHVFVNQPQGGVLFHTNHYLHPEPMVENDKLGTYLANSAARCTVLAREVAGLRAPVSVSDFKSVLSDHTGGPHAVCRHADRDAYRAETNVCVIAEPSERVLHVAFGPPCESPFRSFALPAGPSDPVRRLLPAVNAVSE